MAIEFDERLQQRLRAFQEHHGLSGDGVAGEQTWGKLVSAQPPASGHGAQQRQQGAEQQVVIPLSEFPHLQAFLHAESTEQWLAALGAGGQQEEAQA